MMRIQMAGFFFLLLHLHAKRELPIAESIDLGGEQGLLEEIHVGVNE